MLRLLGRVIPANVHAEHHARRVGLAAAREGEGCARRVGLRHVALLSVIIAASSVCGAVRAEDAVLLTSTVPGYVPGMVVSSTDRLSLPEGASATLLFKSGGTLHLRGPFEGVLEQQRAGSGGGNLAAMADLFRMNGVDATVIGGTRSTGPAQVSAAIDDVQVDPQRSGTYCVEPNTTVWITRPAGAQATYALRRKGTVRMLAWPANAGRSEWPADVPIDDGSQFEIVANGIAHATATFRALPASPAARPARIATGILLGCHDQFDEELTHYSRLVAAPELWITTDHGRHPAYQGNEPIKLTITANTDGFLYCVATRTDGGAAAIFPAGAIDGAQVHRSAPLSIPGGRQSHGLTAGQGLTQVRCWLTDRDITPELPHALVGAPAGRLPDQLSADLDALFQHVGGTRIAMDAVALTDK